MDLRSDTATSRTQILPPRDRVAFEVFCDFDGTITHGDLTDAVLEAFALPEFQMWEHLWKIGNITSQECLSRQVELLRVDRAELIRFATDFPIDEGIFMLDQRCAENGVPLTILSDGIDLLIEAVLHAHGLSHIPMFASSLKWDVNKVPFLSFPYAVQGCQSGASTCKCASVTVSRLSSNAAVYIGDGRSDRCVSAKAQKVFAKGDLREWCNLQGIAYESFETLTHVAESLFQRGPYETC